MKVFVAKGSNPQSPRTAAKTGGQDIDMRPISEQLTAILISSGIDAATSYAANAPAGPKTEESLISRIYEANIEGADYFIYLTTNASHNPFETGVSATIPRNPQARALAESILDSLKSFTGLQNRGVTTRPGLHALVRADMPAVLLETGYSTNEGDSALLREHPELVARGIARGIITYLQSLVPDGDSDLLFTLPDPFYQLYPESCTSYCTMKLHIFTGKKRQPVQKADVTVYESFGGRHIMVYRGQSDKSGRIIPVELPQNSRDPRPSDFCVCVRHPGYLPKNQWLNIKDEDALCLSIELEAKHRQKRA